MEFIHSVLAQDETVTAGTVVSYDLPVNPLSHILLTLKFKQDETYKHLPWAKIPLILSKVEVLYKGSAIFSMNGVDAVACGIFVNAFESWGVNALAADNTERSITILVPLTRTLYSDRECFPRSTRGELILQVTYASSFTGIDTVKAQIETVELPDAAPESFLRMTTLSVTPSATGELDIELPIGNPISELVIFGTTIPLEAADLATIEYAQILVDNYRRFYSHTNFETLHNMAARRHNPPGFWGLHTHQVSAASATGYTRTLPVDPDDHIIANHLWMPFDIERDGKYILETAGKSDVVVRIYAGDQNPIRVVPCEIVAAAGGV